MNQCCAIDPKKSSPGDAAEIFARLEEERVIAASERLDDQRFQTSFLVPDMHCAGCIGTIERGLLSMPQVESVRANLTTRRVAVCWTKGSKHGTEILNFLNRLGFDASLDDLKQTLVDQDAAKGRRLLSSMAVSGFAAANIMLLSISVWSGAEPQTAQLFHLISGIIAVPAEAYAGRPFFQSAFSALSARRLNMDVPISLAVVLALLMSLFESLSGGAEAYFDAAVTLLFFLLIGRYLDHLMRHKARGAADRLARMSSKGAVLIEQGCPPRFIELAEIKPGMCLRVNAGERLPVNGEVLSGESDIDRALVTGESQSQSCRAGDRLEAGVLVLTGSIDIRSTSDAKTSFLAEITQMIQAAERGRSFYVSIADRMARIYAPVVHILALLTFIGWTLATSGDWHLAIYVAIAVLIVTCPCALGLAVPVVHVIAAQRMMDHGLLMRDGQTLERLNEIDHVIFDKTGTLTMAEPTVSASSQLSDQPLAVINALAEKTSHPAAKAVSRHIQSLAEGPSVDRQADLTSLSERAGYGVEAIWQNQRVRLGRPTWVAEIAAGNNLEIKHHGVMFAVENREIIGFTLEDDLRPGAEATILELRRMGFAVSILSGDQPEAVRRVAERLGIEEYLSSLTPQEKIQHVQQRQAQGEKILMVGDGLNDAPALAAGHASMAPASASDVGRLASDVIFTRSDLSAVATACQIARRAQVLVRQNFALALLYNSVAVPLAVLGFVTPLIAAIAMSSSSLIVIANSLRLTRFSNLGKSTQDRPRLVRSNGGSGRSGISQPRELAA